MHEFGLYPNKRTREMRRAEPLRTLLPPVKKKKKSKKNQPVIDSKINPQEELTKLYRAMGI